MDGDRLQLRPALPPRRATSCRALVEHVPDHPAHREEQPAQPRKAPALATAPRAPGGERTKRQPGHRRQAKRPNARSIHPSTLASAAGRRSPAILVEALPSSSLRAGPRLFVRPGAAASWNANAGPMRARRPHPPARLTAVRADSRVDEYIGQLPDWQQVICQQVRELLHTADPEVEETIKRSVQPYFVLQGNICALLATKDHVNVFIYDPNRRRPARHHQPGARERDGQGGAGLPRRRHQPGRPAGDVPGRHRQQPGGRLAASAGA